MSEEKKPNQNKKPHTKETPQNIHWIPLKILFIKSQSKTDKNFSGIFQKDVQRIFDNLSFPIQYTLYPFTVT